MSSGEKRKPTGGRRRSEESAGGDWSESHSISPWRKPLADESNPTESVTVDCGWGRVIFAHTFSDNERLAEVLRNEADERRDIVFYHPDPHVLTSKWPDLFFVDPSHTYRLWLERYEPSDRAPRGFYVRRVASDRECAAVHALYRARQMVPPAPEDVAKLLHDPRLCWLVAVSRRSEKVIGTVLGIDHVEAFRDPEAGSSLWSLAVDPQTGHPGVGESLTRSLAEHFLGLGRRYMDLSVMHDNTEAIALYEKLGFERVPVFAVKRKNPINEPLFVASGPVQDLNPYTRIIVDEARLRGISVEVLDAENGYLKLGFGGRFITCRESLSELTSAIAMSRCDDKRVTHEVLEAAGLRQPEQAVSVGREADEAFLARHERIVVKPRRGEQGAGISVDVRTPTGLRNAVRRAGLAGFGVLLEEFCEGRDLRIIVIDDEVVAAAVRKPAEIMGTGQHTVRQLLRKQSRRRAAATSGESRIPIDAETKRCIAEAGFDLEAVLPEGEVLQVRRTANLHTGGTIHDVTPELSPQLARVAREAARALEIPVVGLDLLVPSIEGDDYVIIEANERPGLANHEPQPTAERFIDHLFPQTKKTDDNR